MLLAAVVLIIIVLLPTISRSRVEAFQEEA
jgi:hypothetical protein